MKKAKNHMLDIFCLSLITTISLCLCSPVHGDEKSLLRKGPAFTDLDKRYRMPEQWREKKISRDSWAKGANLAVTLDQHLYPAISNIIFDFAEKSRLKVAIHEGTCGISAGLLIQKKVDVGGFCCPAGVNDRLPDLEFHTIGIAGIAIIVHPDNPIKNLGLEQLRDIFQGKIYSWDQVMDGAIKRPIRVIGRLHCKQRPGHWRLLLENEDLFSPNMIEVGTIKDMIERVAKDKAAIGYEVIYNLVHYKQSAPVKYIRINNADPSSLEDVASLHYPLYRTYNITTWKNGKNNPLHPSYNLIRHIIASLDKIDPAYSIVPVTLLKKHGWKFINDELIGEP
ncbi:MAG: substrate-binding domain-containing protein [Desulfobulbaceae bacterium]|nr:substrate-binding domain-containing protein [Desulfobulbaceae bacterium]